MPPALLLHLHELAVDLDAGQAMPQALARLIDDLTLAISSYAGLQITIVHTGHPVVLTFFTNLDHTPVATSLRLPLTLTAPDLFEPGSMAVFWAHTPGAFVDMAADLSYALHIPGPVVGHQSRPVHNNPESEPDSEPELITLDVDLPPEPQTSGITGLNELSTINYAIGVLIAQGYEPNHAKQKLRSNANTANQPIAQIAAELLTRASSPGT